MRESLQKMVSTLWKGFDRSASSQYGKVGNEDTAKDVVIELEQLTEEEKNISLQPSHLEAVPLPDAISPTATLTEEGNKTKVTFKYDITEEDLHRTFNYLNEKRTAFSPPPGKFAHWGTRLLDVLNIIALYIITKLAGESGVELAENYGLGITYQLFFEIYFASAYYVANVFVQHQSNSMMMKFIINTWREFQHNRTQPNGSYDNTKLGLHLATSTALTLCATVAVLQQNIDAHVDVEGSEFIIFDATLLKSIQLLRGISDLHQYMLYLSSKSYQRDTRLNSLRVFPMRLTEETIPTNKTYQPRTNASGDPDLVSLIANKHHSSFTAHPATIAGIWIIAALGAAPYSIFAYADATKRSSILGSFTSNLSWVTFFDMFCLFTKSNVSVLTQLFDTVAAGGMCLYDRWWLEKEPHVFYRDHAPTQRSVVISGLLFVVALASLGGAAKVAANESGLNMTSKTGWWESFGIASGIVGINFIDLFATLGLLNTFWITVAMPLVAKGPVSKERKSTIALAAKKRALGENHTQFMRRIGAAAAQSADTLFDLNKQFDLFSPVDDSIIEPQATALTPPSTALSQLWVTGLQDDTISLSPTKTGIEWMRALALLHQVRDCRETEAAYARWLAGDTRNATHVIKTTESVMWFNREQPTTGSPEKETTPGKSSSPISTTDALPEESVTSFTLC